MAARAVMRNAANASKTKKHGDMSGEGQDHHIHRETPGEISRYKHFWDAVKTDIQIQSHKMVDSLFKHKNTQGMTANEILRELRAKWLFNPNDNWKITWDAFVGAMVLYSVIAIPYRVGFRKESPIGGGFFVADLMLDCFFFVDVLIRCNTAILDEITELFILDRRRIFNEYSKFWLWIDLLSCVPFDTIVTGAQGGVTGAYATLRLVRVLRLSRLFKIVRMFKLKRLKKTVENLNVSPSLIALGSLMFQITFLAHFIACFWFYLSTEDVTGVAPPDISYADADWSELPDQRQVTWVTVGNLQHATELDQYVASIYWVITTMLSVGYGEISGTNDTERIFCIFTMLVGGVVFGAVIARVTQMIEKQNPQLSAYKAKMDECKAYLSEKMLPAHLKVNALDAYSYYLKRKSSFGEANILDGLPDELKTKLIYELYFREIKDISLFAQARTYDERQFVVKIVQNIKPQRAVRGEAIFRAGDIAKNIVFVMSGIIRISTLVDDTQEVVAGYCSKGGFFGEIEYHKKTLRLADYRAVLNCSLLSVPTSVFDEACYEYPEAGAKFRKLLDYRSENFQKALKLPPIRSPTKTSATPTLKGSSVTANISAALSYVLKPLGPCVRMFEADPHAAPDQFGGASRQRRPSRHDFTSGKALPSRMQLWVDGELRLPMTLDDEFKMTTDEEVRTYRVMYLDTSSVVFAKEEEEPHGPGTLRRRKTGMGMEPPNSKSDDSNDGKRSSAGRGGDSEDVEAADSTASVKTGTSQKTKRHPHHYNINAKAKADLEDKGVLGRIAAVTRGVWKPLAKLLPKSMSGGGGRGRGRGSKKDRKGPEDDQDDDEHRRKLELELSEKMQDTQEAAAEEEDGETEEEKERRRQEEERRKQGGTVVYCEAGSEFFAYHNLLHPDGKRKNLWSVFITVLVVYSILTVPVQVGFEARGDMPFGLLVWEWVVDFLFFCDILVCFNTSFYSLFDDAYVLIRQRVYNHYLKSMFWVDILSALPYDDILIVIFTSQPSYHPILHLFKLLKLGRAMKLGKYVRDLENQLGISPAMFDLIKLCIEVLFVGHIFCCVTWSMSVAMTKTSWIDDPGNDYSLDGTTLRHETLYSQYVTSLYFTFSTLTTVGYGDITPNNTSERFANIFVEIVGATVFGYMVASVSTLLGSLNYSEEKVRERLSEVTEYLTEKKCPQALSVAILRHFKHKFSHVSAFDEGEILNRLPQRHAVDIVVHNNANQIKHIPIFAHIENKSVCAYIFQLMEPSYYDTNQVIFREGEESTEILFLVRGQAMVLAYVPPQAVVASDTRLMLDDKTLLALMDDTADPYGNGEAGEDPPMLQLPASDGGGHVQGQGTVVGAGAIPGPPVDPPPELSSGEEESKDGVGYGQMEVRGREHGGRRKVNRGNSRGGQPGTGESKEDSSHQSGNSALADPRGQPKSTSAAAAAARGNPLSRASSTDDRDASGSSVGVKGGGTAAGRSAVRSDTDSSSSSGDDGATGASGAGAGAGAGAGGAPNKLMLRLQLMRNRLRSRAGEARVDHAPSDGSSDESDSDVDEIGGDGDDEAPAAEPRGAEGVSGGLGQHGHEQRKTGFLTRMSPLGQAFGIVKKNNKVGAALDKDKGKGKGKGKEWGVEDEEDHHMVTLEDGCRVPNQYKGHKTFPPKNRAKGGMPHPSKGSSHPTRSRQRSSGRTEALHEEAHTETQHKRHLWYDDKSLEAELRKKKTRGTKGVDTKIADIDLENLGSEYRQIGLIDEGDFAGHDALMRGGFHKGTVVAVRPCSIYSLKRSAITQLLREHPAIGAILQTALARCIDTMQKELGRHNFVSSRGEFLKGVKGRFKKETHLTANINKLVLQSELLNEHFSHDRTVGSALQSSLLSANKALVGRIEANQTPRGHFQLEGAYSGGRGLGSPRGVNGAAISVSSSRQSTPRNTPPGTPQRGLRKGYAVHPSPSAGGHIPASGGSASPSRSQLMNMGTGGGGGSRTVASRLHYSERELMARVDSVLNFNTVYYDSEEERYDAMHHKSKKRSLRRRMTEMLTQKGRRDSLSRQRVARVQAKLGEKSAKLIGGAIPPAQYGQATAWDSDSSADSDVDSEQEEQLVRESAFKHAAHRGQMRRHRSYDDLLQCSEAYRVTKYAVPLSDLDSFSPFPNYPTGCLPSHLETKAALASAYRRRLSAQHTISAKSFASLVSEGQKREAVDPAPNSREPEEAAKGQGQGPKTKLGALVKSMQAETSKGSSNSAIKLVAAKRREADLEEGREEVRRMQKEQRLRRRQSFPSPYNDYWRANKIKGGVI